MKLNNRGLQVTLKDNSGDIVTSLDSAGPALWHLQCQMMLLSGVQDEIIGSRRGTQLILPHVNNSLPRDLTSANPGQHRCRDVATTQHYFSGNISRTNWTDSSRGAGPWTTDDNTWTFHTVPSKPPSYKRRPSTTASSGVDDLTGTYMRGRDETSAPGSGRTDVTPGVVIEGLIITPGREPKHPGTHLVLQNIENNMLLDDDYSKKIIILKQSSGTLCSEDYGPWTTDDNTWTFHTVPSKPPSYKRRPSTTASSGVDDLTGTYMRGRDETSAPGSGRTDVTPGVVIEGLIITPGREPKHPGTHLV
ncbi:hypothetical protein Hamer_G016151, partial [Homarus americanus]